MNIELISNISTFTRKCKFINSLAGMRTFAKYFVAPLFIVLQCFVEPEFAEPTKMVAKLDSGFSVAEKLSSEKINSVRIENVNGIGAIKTRAEDYGSSATTNDKIIAPSNVPHERSKQYGSENGVWVGKEGFDHWFLGYVLVAISPLLNTLPNVQIEGRAAFGASLSNAGLGAIIQEYPERLGL